MLYFVDFSHFKFWAGVEKDKPETPLYEDPAPTRSIAAQFPMPAIDLFSKLLTDMPQNPESIENIKKYLKETLLSQQPDTRSITSTIAEWEREGYSDDPSKQWVEDVDKLGFEDILKYYNENIKGKPIIIGIVGNPKEINSKDLARFGKVTRLSDKQIFNDKDVLFQ